MPEYIRVYDEELDRNLTIVKPETLDTSVYELLDEPAVDHVEQPLPPEFDVRRHGAPPPSPYEASTVKELEAEIDARNADRPEEQHISKSGNKSDLVAALEADDANPPLSESGQDGHDTEGDV